MEGATHTRLTTAAVTQSKARHRLRRAFNDRAILFHPWCFVFLKSSVGVEAAITSPRAWPEKIRWLPLPGRRPRCRAAIPPRSSAAADDRDVRDPARNRQ